MTQTSLSEGGIQGIQVRFRLLISQPAEERFTPDGADVLQIRGTVIDDAHGSKHPQVVVRFGGQRRAELTRWAAVGKQLSVEGQLEVKTWAKDGLGHVALLVTAQNLFPLGQPEDLSRIGVYAVPGQTPTHSRKSKGQRADEVRRALASE